MPPDRLGGLLEQRRAPRAPSYKKMEPWRQDTLREGYKPAIRSMSIIAYSSCYFGAWRTSALRREARPLSVADEEHVSDAGGEPSGRNSDFACLPAANWHAIALRSFNGPGGNGCSGAEHHGCFDRSNRAVHNNAACLLLLHKAATAPASRLPAPQAMLGLVILR